MLSIEQEPIRLPSIANEIDGPNGRIVVFSNHRRILMPRRFHFLWDQTKIGASVYDLSLRLRARGENSRVFLEVATYLCFLVDNDLIDDSRIVRLADSIRGEYEWPEDAITGFSRSGQIAVWGRHSSSSSWPSRLYDTVLALVVFFSFLVLLLHNLVKHVKIQKLLNKNNRICYAVDKSLVKDENEECIYLCGHSLGLQPKTARDQVNKEFDKWAKM